MGKDKGVSPGLPSILPSALKARRFNDLRAANQKAGLSRTCLDCRHTFGSQLAMKGEGLYKIATLMENSPETCRRHYAAIIPEELATSVEFGKGTPSHAHLLHA
ncbi:MAG: hypothetical protein NTY65_00365 [Planctomycetota bacterium]|nr:hypothetical protein [Planctomycetota bacterium]